MTFVHRGNSALALLVFIAIGPCISGAAQPPADPCQLLPAATISSTLGDTFGDPTKSVAPRPFANTVQGTDCHYKGSNGTSEVLLRVYFDPSVPDSTALFAKLKMFFGADSSPATVGDEAYVDANHAIHVRKGSTRYFIVAPHANSTTGQQRLLALANAVAAKL